MSQRPLRKHAEVLAEVLPQAGRKILDVGCGEGALVRLFARNGAEAEGIDPLAQAIERAKAADHVPGTSFRQGGGESLPYADDSFDAVCFFNSLHHVPQALMDKALAEAARVVCPGGEILVVEPLACGRYFELMRPVEDETEVRAHATAALAAFAKRASVEVAEPIYYDAPYRYRDFAEMERSVLSVDPRRSERMARHRQAISARFEADAERDQEGRYLFRQPARLDLFRKRG